MIPARERESSCQTNADCNQNGKSGYYCYTKGGEGCSVEFGSSRIPGTCQPVSSDLNKKAKIDGTTYYGSGRNMTWWSACRLCAARAGVDESVCASGTEAELDFMGGRGDPDFKCAGMTNLSARSYCKSDSSKDYGSSNLSETIVALRKMYNSSSYFLWLKNNYSSCIVYYVNLNSGYVSHYSRGNSNSALCRDLD